MVAGAGFEPSACVDSHGSAPPEDATSTLLDSLDDLVGVEARLRAANKRITVVTGSHRRAGLRRVGGGGRRGAVSGRLARADRARRADSARAHSKRGDRREHERDLLEHPHRLPPPFRCVLLTSFEVGRRQRVTASGASARASHDRYVLVALSPCNHDPNADSPRKVSIFRTTVQNASCTTSSASCPSPGTASTFISLPRVVGRNVVFICREGTWARRAVSTRRWSGGDTLYFGWVVTVLGRRPAGGRHGERASKTRSRKRNFDRARDRAQCLYTAGKSSRSWFVRSGGSTS